VNKYREGKAKRTPVRGVKENLKPTAYKRSKAYIPIRKMADGVPFAWWASELSYMARLRDEEFWSRSESKRE
jgi:hypothetical protein